MSKAIQSAVFVPWKTLYYFLRSNILSCANVLGHEVGGGNIEQVVISNVYSLTYH